MEESQYSRGPVWMHNKQVYKAKIIKSVKGQYLNKNPYRGMALGQIVVFLMENKVINSTLTLA